MHQKKKEITLKTPAATGNSGTKTMKYTKITRTEKANGSKNYWVKINRLDFEEEIFTTWGWVDHYFAVYYFWYNGKRQMNASKDFNTIEDAQKFFDNKIKELEAKIA